MSLEILTMPGHEASDGGDPRAALRRLAAADVELITDADASAWLRRHLRTFAVDVGSFVPRACSAVARLYHPPRSETSGGARSWRALAAAARVDLRDHEAMGHLRASRADLESEAGTLPRALVQVLLAHLSAATGSTCYFALWAGFGDTPVPPGIAPSLRLPAREYHVFRGPLSGAAANFSAIPFAHRSPSLWWPAEDTWCVATDVDLAWTYIAGNRTLVRALVEDPALDAAETQMSARW